MDLQKLGKRIRDKREELNVTQSYVAYKLNISPQAVSKWERGENAPGIENLIPLSKALNCTVEYILVDYQ